MDLKLMSDQDFFYRRFLLVFCSFFLLIFFTSCHDSARFKNQEFYYAVTIGDGFTGKRIVKLDQKKVKKTRILEMISMADIRENAETIFDSTTVKMDVDALRPLFARKVFISGPDNYVHQVTYSWEDSFVTIMLKTPRKDFPFYMATVENLQDNEGLWLWLSLINLKPGMEKEFYVVSPASIGKLPSILRVLDYEEIRVPGGAFSTCHVEIELWEKFSKDALKSAREKVEKAVEQLQKSIDIQFDFAPSHSNPYKEFTDYCDYILSFNKQGNDTLYKDIEAEKNNIVKLKSNKVDFWMNKDEPRILVKYRDDNLKVSQVLISMKKSGKK